MNAFEKSILDKTKIGEGLSLDDIEELEKSELENIDKAAIMAIDVLRSELENKEEEGLALWRFIRYLTEIEMPMQIIDYSGLLFPGNDAYYEKSLTPTAFKMIQQQASLMIANEKYEDEKHKEWLQNIADGKLPYGYSIRIVKGGAENE